MPPAESKSVPICNEKPHTATREQPRFHKNYEKVFPTFKERKTKIEKCFKKKKKKEAALYAVEPAVWSEEPPSQDRLSLLLSSQCET